MYARHTRDARPPFIPAGGLRAFVPGQAELDKGTPHTYRFRVPTDEWVVIDDLVRGEVKWNTDTLGDFVLLRSNGLPVYNFCVAVDDATMGITHVLRAEEHLPNTLRQMLVYQASPPAASHACLFIMPLLVYACLCFRGCFFCMPARSMVGLNRATHSEL